MSLPESFSRRLPATALVVVAVAVAVVVLIGTGFRSSRSEFHASGMWLALQSETERSISHVDPVTGQVDVKLGLDVVDGRFEVAQGDEGVYIVETGSCRIHRVDEARLNLSNRDPGTPAEALPGAGADRTCGEANVVMGSGALHLWGPGPGSGEVTIAQYDPRSLRGGPLVSLTVDGQLGDGRLLAGDDGRVFAALDDSGQVSVLRDGQVESQLSLFPEGAELRMARVGDRLLVLDRRPGAVAAPTRAVVLDGEGDVLHRIGVEAEGSLRLLRAQEGPWAWFAVDPVNSGAAPRLMAIDVRAGEVATAGTEISFAPSRPVGGEGFVLAGDAQPSSAGVLRSVDDEVEERFLDLGREVAEVQLADLAGHLWFHSPESPRGWVCTTAGTCRSFDKSRALIELDATDPEEEDPEPDPEARTATTAETVVVAVPELAPVPTSVDPSAEPTVVPPATGGGGGGTASGVVTPSAPDLRPPPPPVRGLPSAPRELVAEQINQPSERRIRVSWAPPASDGGSTIVGYEVRVRGPGGYDETFRPGELREEMIVREGGLHTVEVSAIVSGALGDAARTEVTVRTSGPAQPEARADTGEPNSIRVSGEPLEGFGSYVVWCAPRESPGDDANQVANVTSAQLRGGVEVGGLTSGRAVVCSVEGSQGDRPSGASAPSSEAVPYGNPGAPSCSTVQNPPALACQLSAADDAVNTETTRWGGAPPVQLCIVGGSCTTGPAEARIALERPGAYEVEVQVSAPRRSSPEVQRSWSIQPVASIFSLVTTVETVDGQRSILVQWSVGVAPEYMVGAEIVPTASRDLGGVTVFEVEQSSPTSGSFRVEAAEMGQYDIVLTADWDGGFESSSSVTEQIATPVPLPDPGSNAIPMQPDEPARSLPSDRRGLVRRGRTIIASR